MPKGIAAVKIAPIVAAEFMRNGTVLFKIAFALSRHMLRRQLCHRECIKITRIQRPDNDQQTTKPLSRDFDTLRHC